MTESKSELVFVYRESLETPPAIWGSCCHCGALAEEFCTRCRPLGAFWCRSCCKEYHGYWKKRGPTRVFVPVRWTKIYHQPDLRLARKSEKRAHLDNRKKGNDYQLHNRELEVGDIDFVECLEEEALPLETLRTPTTRRSYKKRTGRVATVGSVATPISPVGSSKSVTTAVTFVLSARNGMTRPPPTYIRGKSTSSR